MDDILDDVALTRTELGFLMEAPADAGRQIDAMAKVAGVDLTALPPTTRREAEWVCTRCACRERCKRWMRTGEWQDEADTRCANAALFRH